MMEKLDVSRCYSRPVNYETAARIVKDYHYAKRVPSIVVAVGMWVDDILAGVITYGIPPNRNALGFCGEEYIPNALELNRLFVFDWAGYNSESWLIGQSFSWIEKERPEYYLLVSYADPMQDHYGTIYQATNWIYTGTGNASAPSDARVNGKIMSEKNIFNIYGTHNRSELRDKHGLSVEEIERLPKHRYVYILGSKGQRKRMRKKIVWPILPYPKRNNT